MPKMKSSREIEREHLDWVIALLTKMKESDADTDDEATILSSALEQRFDVRHGYIMEFKMEMYLPRGVLPT